MKLRMNKQQTFFFFKLILGEPTGNESLSHDTINKKISMKINQKENRKKKIFIQKNKV